MNKFYFILFLFIGVILCNSACVTPVDGNELVEDAGTIIYVESVLKNNEYPSVSIKSAESAYSGRIPTILSDQEVEVSIGTSDWTRTLDYSDEKFTLTDFKLAEGIDYSLNVIHKNNQEIKSAYSKVEIPFKERFSEIQFIEDHNAEATIGYYNYSYDVSVTFKEESNGDYYLVLPVSRNVSFDNTIVQYNNEYNPYTVNEIYNAPNGMRITNDSQGLLIDLQKSNENSVMFNISIDGNQFGFNGNRLQKHVYFYLWNITEDYYKYLKSGGGFISASNTIIEPVIEHSNIDNGGGILGGAAITLDSIAIQ